MGNEAVTIQSCRTGFATTPVHSARYARMLSRLAYDQIHKTLVSRAYREGVDTARVNPAYTSVIGRTKFSGQYG
ncbi:hypothetical protein, partial [Endozoicomonas sp. ONNA2]|uniref:hypothetical protein n=1 Tax=Endozoicomonas sp. ONNA2 TaxID=2828741 RepID=UPI002147C24A